MNQNNINKYIDKYNKLSKFLIDKKLYKDTTPMPTWIEIVNNNTSIDTNIIIKAIIEQLKQTYVDPRNMYNQCATVTELISKLLIMMKIKHSITVGNFFIKDEPFYNVSPDSIWNDMCDGFSLSGFNGHLWITLENGEIIDPTIYIAVEMRKEKPSAIDWKDCIFTHKNNKIDAEHSPYYLGLEYYIYYLLDNKNPVHQQNINSWGNSLQMLLYF